MSMAICKTLPKRQGHRRYAALAVNSELHCNRWCFVTFRTGNSGDFCGDTLPRGAGVATPVYYTVPRSLGMFPGPGRHRRHLCAVIAILGAMAVSCFARLRSHALTNLPLQVAGFKTRHQFIRSQVGTCFLSLVLSDLEAAGSVVNARWVVIQVRCIPIHS